MEAPGKLPPLPALRSFEAAARLLSFSRAADELHVTHGAVSHQIRALEAQLGLALFARDTRGLRLTPAGEALLQATNGALRGIADAVAGLRRHLRPDRLSVSVMPSFAGRWLAPRLAAFLDANPGCELNVLSSDAITDFARDGTDLAIRWGFGGYSGVHSELLMDDVMFPVVSPHFAGGVPRTPAGLAGLPLLRSVGEDWLPWFRAAGLDWPEPSRGLVLSDSGLLVQAAIDGQGVALARRSLAMRAVREGRLLKPFDIEVPLLYGPGQGKPPSLGLAPDGTPKRWRFWLVWPLTPAPTPLLQRFVAWLHAEVAAELDAAAATPASSALTGL
ncbi:transcriptional regulator GcvA [Azoarcus olearius]|uniref:Probable transcriptional regulator, LysR family n=1 Tax=Azoarcus sp. (strain BH72) TaxID=418699 RepID=A1K292_AZOSB|nr:transcriptional regulator GcvA [Azoarcus olearius]CAL92947.1 probable transcriptional regulator, LysR family [Azoarcus olearius]